MFNKTKGKVLAATLAVVMAVTAIPAGGGVEAQAARKKRWKIFLSKAGNMQNAR